MSIRLISKDEARFIFDILGKTNQAAAYDLGVSRTTVSNWFSDDPDKGYFPPIYAYGVAMWAADCCYNEVSAVQGEILNAILDIPFDKDDDAYMNAYIAIRDYYRYQLKQASVRRDAIFAILDPDGDNDRNYIYGIVKEEEREFLRNKKRGKQWLSDSIVERLIEDGWKYDERL